jgi:hypothetical protein
MKEWLTIFATLLGRIGTVGVILVLFSVGAIYAEGRGAHLPTMIVEWSRAGAILGSVLTIVGGLSKLGNLVQGFVRRMSDRRSDEREIAESAREAIANLGTLQTDEADYLYKMLSSGRRRFHVGTVTPAPGLMSKKILVWKSDVSAFEWICELHPEIEKRRDHLTGLLEKSMRDRGGL